MLSKNIKEALNAQIEKEAYASQLYLAMAVWADANGMEGISQWFYAQSEEERMHMLKIIKYVNERGEHAVVPKVDQPPHDFKSIKAIFDASLEHEQMVTKSINDIVALCLDEKDFSTNNWIQWFVDEQLEEESSVNAIIDKLNLVGEKNIYQFDRDIMQMRGE